MNDWMLPELIFGYEFLDAGSVELSKDFRNKNRQCNSSFSGSNTLDRVEEAPKVPMKMVESANCNDQGAECIQY